MSRVSEMLKVLHKENAEIFSVKPETSLFEAARYAREKQVGALLVVRDEKMVGIITERDLAFRVLAEAVDPRKETVANFMTVDPDYVTTFTDIMDCLKLMEDKKIRHIPVLEGEKLKAIISLRDVLVVLMRNWQLLAMDQEAYIRGSSYR